jgi:type I restriction enzyme S subunit
MKWCDATLREVIERDGGLVQTGPFGSQLHQSDYQSQGIPVIMPKDIADGLVMEESVARVAEDTVNRLQRHKLKPRSIVLPRRGEITKRAFIRPEQEGWLCGTGCLKVELNGKEVLPEYLYYFMAQRSVVQWLEQHAVGTTMLNLSAGIVEHLPIRYPSSIDTQNDIATTLSNYDNLIQNNRRRIALLEEAALLLYQEWFVHLHFPGHEHTPITNGLPEGWTDGTIADFYETASGGTPSRRHPEYFTGEIPWVKTQELLNGFITDTQEAITEDGLANSSAKLFPSKTVIMALYGATVGELGILAMEAATNQACCALFPKDPRSHYIHSFLFCQQNKQNLIGLSAGAAQNNISQQIVRTFKMTMPSASVMSSFVEHLDPVFDQLLNLQRQNQKLRAARDLLLPRLMNGEILV